MISSKEILLFGQREMTEEFFGCYEFRPERAKRVTFQLVLRIVPCFSQRERAQPRSCFRIADDRDSMGSVAAEILRLIFV